ncbi:MAG: hypothetical protein PUA84_04365 [Oscillospiraceae bacterium]|nr:hypothetical protein [Oscillospiraceae bacterium]
MSKESIYNCPHCGEKSFNPVSKALAGGLNSQGKVCKSCGRRCCNGKVSTIVNAVIYIIALVGVVLSYLFINNNILAYGVMAGCIAAAWLLGKLFDAFFMPLTKVIRNDVRS